MEDFLLRARDLIASPNLLIKKSHLMKSWNLSLCFCQRFLLFWDFKFHMIVFLLLRTCWPGPEPITSNWFCFKTVCSGFTNAISSCPSVSSAYATSLFSQVPVCLPLLLEAAWWRSCTLKLAYLCLRYETFVEMMNLCLHFLICKMEIISYFAVCNVRTFCCKFVRKK